MNMIQGDSEMIRAWREGSDGYIPSFEGLNLGVEMSDPGTSESNLKALLGSGRRVCAMHVGSGGVLVVFHTGETYLATGFSIDSATTGGNSPTYYLARFCSRVWSGSERKWFDLLVEGFGDDFQGEIDPQHFPKGSGPCIYTPDTDDSDDSEEDIHEDHR